MRLIPRNTKVQTSFYKGITIADVILGLVGLGLAALAVASNLPYRLLIALGIACLFIPLFIPVGEERIYKCALYLARHIFSRKKYTAKGKDAANIQSIIPYERIDGNCIVNKDGGFTGVLEIKPIEFRLLGANKQNYLIDGVLTNVLTGVGASQEAAIVKLENRSTSTSIFRQTCNGSSPSRKRTKTATSRTGNTPRASTSFRTGSRSWIR